jgi:hypothetical protein
MSIDNYTQNYYTIDILGGISIIILNLSRRSILADN